MLWGHPATAGYIEGGATINPLGQFAGAVIMFFVLGFLPAWILAKIMNAFGMLRIPPELEIAGLDLADFHDRYLSDEDVTRAEEEEARRLGLIR